MSDGEGETDDSMILTAEEKTSLAQLADMRDIRTKSFSVNKAKRTVEALVSSAQTKRSRASECQQEIGLLEKERDQLLKHIRQIEADVQTLKTCVDAENRGSDKMLSRARYALEETYYGSRRELDELRKMSGLPPAQTLDLKEEHITLALSAEPYKPDADGDASSSTGNIEPAAKRRKQAKRKSSESRRKSV